MLGTAFPAARLLLVEQPGPWGQRGLRDSRFDRAVARRARERGPTARASGCRPIRRPGRTPAARRRAVGPRRHPRRPRVAAVGHVRRRRRAARAAARRTAGRPDDASALPGLRAQQARHLLRAARPAGRRRARRRCAPAGCGSAATSAATGSPPTSSCCRRVCCTGGCCRSRPRSSSPRPRPARWSGRCCADGRAGAGRPGGAGVRATSTSRCAGGDACRCSPRAGRRRRGARCGCAGRTASSTCRAGRAGGGRRADLPQPAPATATSPTARCGSPSVGRMIELRANATYCAVLLRALPRAARGRSPPSRRPPGIGGTRPPRARQRRRAAVPHGHGIIVVASSTRSTRLWPLVVLRTHCARRAGDVLLPPATPTGTRALPRAVPVPRDERRRRRLAAQGDVEPRRRPYRSSS